ncbi:LOW QUALITY PROTEIN: uncharacterized protein LOC103709835 [Phoenix dactylifera]|uniref:LOW QUALITY PROTEIN: uncharacterized protein LOC103709835 n=1 Tax=Phoenix dactylifera TaxID=42345 RepID=A0A8B7C7Z4_PHODC|nr:LOW QUALITY PROTEIN: uncharacterized protein LOC103709835 [Phoenix dactylifera]
MKRSGHGTGREKEAKEKESTIRNQLEKEMHDLKAEMSSCQKSGSSRSEADDESGLIRILEAEGEVGRLKELLDEEKKRSNSEKKNAEVEKKKAAEAWKFVEVEKSKVEEVKKHVEIARNKADEYRLCLEKLKMEANEAREKLIAEISKADDANKKVEAEKQKINRERERADMERTKAEEQRRLMEVERKKAMGEKYRADNLSQRLEKEKQRSEELQRKVEEILSTGRDVRGCSCFGDKRSNGGTNIKTADVKLLREQLKLKKKQVKHAKRMNKLEKAENRFIRKELSLLKQDFMQMSCRFNVLYDFLSCSMEGTDSLAKNGESPELWGCNLQNNLLGPQPCNFNSQSDFSLPEICYTNSLNHPCSARECPRLQLSRGSCTRPTSGISSELEPPVGGSVRIKSQSSAVCSTATSFSDSKFMGSQGKDALFATASTEVAEKSSNQRSSILRLSGGVAKTRQTENIGVVTENNNRTSVQRNVINACLNSSAVSVVDQASNSRRKKRRIQDALESVAWLYSEDGQLHLKIGEKLSELKYLLNRKGNIPSGVENSGISEYLDDRKGFCAKNHNDRSKKSCKHRSNKMLRKQQKNDVLYLNQNDVQKQAEKYETEDSRVPCALREMAKPFQMKENAVCREEPSNAVCSKQADLISFEKMICGDYMKLLDLDSDTDERRYRAAIEMPLSPTLPEIESASLKLCVQDDSHFLIEGTLKSFETERSNSLPFHTFDVIELEISSNTVKQKAPSFAGTSLNDNPVLSHSSEEVRIHGTIVTDGDFKHHDMLCNIEHNPSFLENDSNMDVEPTYNGSKSGDSVQKASDALPIMGLKDHWEFKHLVHGQLGPNTISDSKVSEEAVSGGSDKSLLSGSTSCSFPKFTLHSEQLCENCYMHNSIPKIHNLSRELVNVPNGTHGLTHATVTTSTEIHIEGKGEKHDGAIVSQSGEMLDKSFEAEKSEQHGNLLVSECATKTEASESMPMSTIRKIRDLCAESDGLELEKIPKYFVVFSNMDDCSKTRISQYSKTVISQGCMDTQVLRAIAMDPELLPKEKAAVFFSLLLCNISGTLSANSRCTRSGEFLLPSGSFAEEINKVLSNGEARWLILEICQLNILVELIEDFLINRKVLLYTDRLLEPLSACFSSQEFHQLNGSGLCVSTRDATVDQIIAGCVIFASISAAVGCIGIVLELSYRILRTCRNDISWILLALHVFAFVCGEKFFNLDDCQFLLNAIRLVVSLVEHGNESAHSASCLHSTQHMLIFPPCEQCPFATDEFCMDNFACSLLDELQFYALAGNINHLDGKKSTASIGTFQSCSERNDGGTVSKTKVSGLKTECVGSCSIYKFGKLAADRSDCFPESSFCYFTDIISLVELIGCYMRWDWTYDKIVSHIVNMLEFCKSEEFLAALFVLVGQLGRFGIDDGGYLQIGVAELRCSLSRILDASLTQKRSIPTQFSAVGALLNLLPFNFEEIVDGHPELSQDATEYGYVTQVKKWFSHLSMEQQAISFELFR